MPACGGEGGGFPTVAEIQDLGTLVKFTPILIAIRGDFVLPVFTPAYADC